MTCPSGKLAFPSWSRAATVAARMTRRDHRLGRSHSAAYAYHCRHCGAFHTTSRARRRR